MKRIILVTVFVTFIATSCFAKVVPPRAVESAFKQKFPTATKISWGKENAHEYEADFTENGVEHSANFSEAGKWVETETRADFNSLPTEVKAAFNAQHKGAKQNEVAKIERANGVIYEIEIQEGKKGKDCLYYEDGSSVK